MIEELKNDHKEVDEKIDRAIKLHERRYHKEGYKMVSLSDIERKLEKVDKKLEESSLAMEILRELKKSGQRKFVIIIILIFALIVTNVGWLIYNAQFETVTEETIVDSEDNGIATYLENSNSGDINYGKDN